jgi:parallel beta-helix repeat protein
MSKSHLIGALCAAAFSFVTISSSAFAAAATNVKCKGCIGASDIAKNAITSSKIKKESVTKSKLSASLKASLGLGGSVTVDCDNGGSVGSALASGNSNITVLGTCNEFVLIRRDDVMLTAHVNGGSIISPIDEPAIIVDGAKRVTLAGLTIGGIESGIELDGGASVEVDSVTIDSVGNDGIEVFSNSNIFVEGSTITNNSGFGVQLDTSSYGEITGTTISGNARMGIIVSGGSSAEIGDTGNGNTITNNSEGIHIQSGSTATLSSNTISGQLTGFGIAVHSNSTVILAGGNSITSNGSYGIYAEGATVNQFSNSSTETITQNVGGIFLRDAKLTLLDATVNGGTWNGIDATGNSSMRIFQNAVVTDGVVCSSSRPYIDTSVGVNVDTVTTCSNP